MRSLIRLLKALRRLYVKKKRDEKLMRKATSQVELQRCNPNRTAGSTCECVSESTEGKDTANPALKKMEPDRQN